MMLPTGSDSTKPNLVCSCLLIYVDGRRGCLMMDAAGLTQSLAPLDGNES